MKPFVRILNPYFALVMTILSLLTFSCKKSPDSDQGKEYGNLLISNKEFNKIMSARESHTGQTFTIENITRKDDQLTITVKGGCDAKDFRIVWSGAVMESYPMQVPLVLHLNTDAAQSCPADTHSVLINLTKIIGTHDAKDYVFHIANGSIKQDKSIDQNGTVKNR